MMHLNDIKNPKTPKNFNCEKCQFTCSNKKDFTRHVLTRKHLKNVQMITNNDTENLILPQKLACDCGKEYSYRQGLYSHKKKCALVNTAKPESQNEIIAFLLSENKEFKQLIIEQNKTMIEMASKPSMNNSNNNSNNTNQFNIQLFLNEKCKDALNIAEFVKTIKLTFDDLLNTEKLGYVKGISNIIVNGLRQLEVCKRPIHCSDVKRETIYVKDHHNKWEKDDEAKNKTKNFIRDVSNKNSNQILPWADATEGSDDGTHKNGHLFMRVAVAACGGNEEELNKVVTLIASKIAIDKTDA